MLANFFPTPPVRMMLASASAACRACDTYRACATCRACCRSSRVSREPAPPPPPAPTSAPLVPRTADSLLLGARSASDMHLTSPFATTYVVPV